jgi:hypothetical protein
MITTAYKRRIRNLNNSFVGREYMHCSLVNFYLFPALVCPFPEFSKEDPCKSDKCLKGTVQRDLRGVKSDIN